MQGGAPAESAYSAATVSSGPQPASMFPPQPPPVMLPPLHYQGLDAAQPFGYQPPPAAAPMGRMPGMGPPGGPQLGSVRSAEEMEGADEHVPPAKRQKIPKLPVGQFYPEQDWINLHPVRNISLASGWLKGIMLMLCISHSIRFHSKCNCPTIRRRLNGSLMDRS